MEQHNNPNLGRNVYNGLASLFRKLTHSVTASHDQSPKEGDCIRGKIVLKLTPSLLEPYYVKFAAVQHSLYRDVKRYQELQPFLPAELEFVGPPVPDQNCFAYALNHPKKIDRFEFAQELDRLGYNRIERNQLLIKGDIVCYLHFELNDNFSHAGVLVKDNIVASRWGEDAPVLEHPIDQVLPEWMDEAMGSWISFRKPK